MENRYPAGSPRWLDRSTATLQEDAGMTRPRTPSIRLLSLGAGLRLLGAALIVTVLWGMFFWATSTPGGA